MSSESQSGHPSLWSLVPAIISIGPTGDLPCESFEGRGSKAESLRDEVTSYIITSLTGIPLGEIFTFPQPTSSIPYHLVSVRVRNCFQGNRTIETWADLSAYSVDELFQTPNAGKQSVEVLVNLALGEVLRGDAEDAEPNTTRWPGWEDLRTVVDWSRTTQSTKFFGDAFTVRADLGQLPRDVAEAWQRLETSNLAHIVDTGPDDRPAALNLLAALSESEHAAFCRRNLSADSPTLEEVGTEIGVTRERVRQLQQKAEKKLSDAMEHESNRRLRWRVDQLRLQLGVAFPEVLLDEVLPGDGSEPAETERRLLLWLAGPYTSDAGWLVDRDTSLDDVWKMVGTELLTKGRLSRVEALAVLGEVGVVERAADTLLQAPLGMRPVGSEFFPWSGSVADKAEIVLDLLGRPATDQELVDHIGEGHARRTLRNRLMEEDRFMRTDRDAFALRVWDLEEYSGISEEIAERIERAGGEAVLEEVITELLDTFDVAESSVRQYAAAHRFIQADGKIRLRTDEEIVVRAADPVTIAGVYRPSGDRLLVAFDVTADTIRGSGKGIPQPVAVALGATPGNEVAFSCVDTDDLRVVWRLESASGPAIGSLASLSASVNAQLGDVVVVDFHLPHRTARPQRATKGALLPALRETLEEGAGDDVDLLALALGVERGAVRAVLRRRGDDQVIDELPSAQIDDSLRSALEGLTDVLGDPD